MPADLGSDRLTFRRLLRVILPNLPRESAFKKAIDPVGAMWGPGEYIAADIFDVLRGANWQRANEGSKNPSANPELYPRPGDQAQKQSEEEIKIAVLLAQRERALTKRKAEGGDG